MNLIRRNYDFAGLFVMLSGLLYALTFLVNGWGALSKTLLIIGILFLVMGFLLRKRLRWLAYFAYVFMLISHELCRRLVVGISDDCPNPSGL